MFDLTIQRPLHGCSKTILYRAKDEERYLFWMGFLCAPSPDDEPVNMATALISSTPVTAMIPDAAVRKGLANSLTWPISHALIGSEIVDRLSYPACTKSKAQRTLFLC